MTNSNVRSLAEQFAAGGWSAAEIESAISELLEQRTKSPTDDELDKLTQALRADAAFADKLAGEKLTDGFISTRAADAIETLREERDALLEERSTSCQCVHKPELDKVFNECGYHRALRDRAEKAEAERDDARKMMTEWWISAVPTQKQALAFAEQVTGLLSRLDDAKKALASYRNDLDGMTNEDNSR
jgi:hypothetical protein